MTTAPRRSRTVERLAATVETRSLAWQVFFPATTRYEGAGLTGSLHKALAERSGDGPEQVLVASGRAGIERQTLARYEGLVLVGARGQEALLGAAGFTYIHRYIALPSIENLRWLLPVEHAAAAAAVTLPGTFRLRSRLQRAALLVALKLGVSRWQSRLVTVASRQRPALIDAIEKLFPDRDLTISLATGTPGPMRKPTLACLDRDGAVLAFAKVATSSVSEALVRNEASVLRYIAGTARLRGIAPHLLLETECDGRTTLVQSPLDGHPAGLAFGNAHRRFLANLHGDDQHSAAVARFLARVRERLDARPDSGPLKRMLDDTEVALAGVQLPPALMHGDFAPWNLRQKQGDIAAFDWEYGVIDGLPLLDELHFAWNTGSLLNGIRPKALLHDLDARARAEPALNERQARGLVNLYLLHALLHRLEMGCSYNESLVKSYRLAIRLRASALTALA